MHFYYTLFFPVCHVFHCKLFLINRLTVQPRCAILSVKKKGGKNMKESSLKTLDLCYIALFSAIISVSAWISIPTAVPFTLQLCGVFSSVLLLGGRRGTLSILVYLLLGAVGLPVFSGFTGGLGRLFGSSGGYLLGFLLIGLLYWFCEKKMQDRQVWKMVVLLLGLILDYVIGTLWFVAVYTANTGEVDLITAIFWCVTPFIIPDLTKLVVAQGISKKISPYVKP